MLIGDYRKRLREDTKILQSFNNKVSRSIVCKTKCGIRLTSRSKRIIGVIIEDANGDELYIKYSILDNYYNSGKVALTNNPSLALPICYIKAVANSKV